jgi:hypothetical protein
MDVLARIKRLVVRGNYRFSTKALHELDVDGLEIPDVIEAILNAQAIKKTIRSTSPGRDHARERLYIIESFNYSGTLLYTKGKVAPEQGQPIFYFLISAKRATAGE